MKFASSSTTRNILFRHEFEVAQKSHDDILQKQAEKLELSQKENSEMKIEIDNLRLQVAQEWFLFNVTKTSHPLNQKCGYVVFSQSHIRE